MDQYLNNRQNEFLWKLLANTADNGHLYTPDLQRLVSEFPQSGLLHALLTRSDSGQATSHAAAYYNPKTLYSLINSPDSLAEVVDTQIIQELSDTTHYAVKEVDVREQESYIVSDEITESPVVTDQEAETEEQGNSPVVVVGDDEIAEVESIEQSVNTEQSTDEPEQVIPEEQIEEEENREIIELPEDEEPEIETIITPEETEPNTEAGVDDAHDTAPIVINEENETFYEDELVTEAGGIEQDEISDENIPQEDSIAETVSFEPVEDRKDIEDDIYDEIVGIEDISFTHTAKPVSEETQPIEALSEADEKLPDEISAGQEADVNTKDRVLNLDDEAEKLIVGNIAATDYFAFDRAVGDRKQNEVTESDQGKIAGKLLVEVTTPGTEKQDVSKYHDEKMPYTFMWWLDKTRKEHAGIYQPFKLDTTQAIRQSGAEELQQQYYENIFHLNAVEELNRSTSQQTVEFDLNTKEDRIIKKFMVEEPHISAPSSDKLDNENKAKRSAEDQDELVTETLARIYSDQMLYHKAINTYQKLMLKFPEKSRYFADQIEQLERKTN